MQQIKFVFFLFCLCGLSESALSADLLPDEQDPTASEAVATVTANEDFLTDTYVVPDANDSAINTPTPVPSEVDILNEIFGTPDSQSFVQPQATPPLTRTFSPQTGVERTDKDPILTPLQPLPIIPNESVIEPKKTYFRQTGFADQALATAEEANTSLSMPREIRITFYTGQSTFSAHALKWAKAFAIHVINHPTLVAEIRVSEKNWSVQEKRLAVLLQILKEAGVSAHQIRLYKTGRDENSILMGYADNPDYTLVKNVRKKGEGTQKTINW